MKKGRPSITAQAASFLRAVHQSLPVAERISQDPYAAKMLDSRFSRWLAGKPRVARLLERWRNGVIDVIATRDRFADEHARVVLRNGGQLVMLGAGLDTMAWRIENIEFPQATYEVDFLATQEYRQRILNRSGMVPPGGELVRIAMDFESESLVSRLQSAGLSSDHPSLINWLGVSYYLEEDAVAGVLRDVRTLTNPQSILVLDFFRPPHETVKVSRVFRRAGEPLKFFIQPADFPAFALKHGYEVVDLVSLNDLIFRYSNRQRTWDSPVFVAAIRPLP